MAAYHHDDDPPSEDVDGGARFPLAAEYVHSLKEFLVETRANGDDAVGE